MCLLSLKSLTYFRGARSRSPHAASALGVKPLRVKPLRVKPLHQLHPLDPTREGAALRALGVKPLLHAIDPTREGAFPCYLLNLLALRSGADGVLTRA